ncbi:MAG: DUF4838 domain-containing protein [Fuerstiella sp.]|nr:DUF4838 domain-containing protein [Fuerstiella sp.]MCP4857839.1 DUF4838 domain-containing protein [Fuerstiella sp.]
MIKTSSIAILVLIATLGYPAWATAKVTIVRDGRPLASIVLSEQASPSEKWAAEDLAIHIKQISGAELRIVTGSELVPQTAFVVGDGLAARALGVTIDADQLGPDGYMIKTVDNHIIIAGGRRRGTMYGVYTLLESLGCRWWYPGETTIPEMKTVVLPDMSVMETPALEYRDFLYGEMDDSPEAQLWRARNKVNGGFFKTMGKAYGGAYTFDTLVHSYGRLVPPGRHFGEHPEYFALKRGKRVSSQPCFSSDAMVNVMAGNILREAADHPQYKHFTVGQNDNNDFCECEQCLALAREHGHSGMQLDFAARIAAIVRKKYPGMTINVPAYTWSRQPPRGIKPDENMSITLCSIECNFGQPLAEGIPEVNAKFKQDILGWSRMSRQLLIWDYTTNFKHYLLPYPNYYVLAPNVKFYVDHKVAGIMHQGSHSTRQGQQAPLCMWVLAKAMWNPNQDGRELVGEFVRGYYGPAAGAIQNYLDTLDAAKQKTKRPLYCRWTKATYLNDAMFTPELVRQSELTFASALELVQNDPVLLRRVKIAHLPMQYLVIKRARKLWPAVQHALPDANFAAYCETFAHTARNAQVTLIGEGDPARFLYDWAVDYAGLLADDPGADLPTNLKEADLSTVHFLQAAQFTGQMRFLVKADGATDGWAQKVISHGWSIQHRLAPPYDYQASRRYNLYVRVRATAEQKATKGYALRAGVHVKKGGGTRGGLPMAQADGQWHTLNLGEFKGPAEGGGFFICLDTATKDFVSDAQVDCMWITASSGP